MAKLGFLARHGIVRNAIKKDMFYFAIPGVFFFTAGLVVSGLDRFWSTVWSIIRHPQSLFMLPVLTIGGLAMIFTGLTIMTVAQITLFRSYSATLVIREDHRLITHGIYRFVRNQYIWAV